MVSEGVARPILTSTQNAICVLALSKAHVPALNTAHILRLTKADNMALNKAHVLRQGQEQNVSR